MKNLNPSLQSPPSSKEVRQILATRKLLTFTEYTFPEYSSNWHHALLCNYLDRFIKGEIKNLMVFMPPQHGKSELVSRRLPAYLLGVNPKLKIVGASYSGDLARQFNRSVQRIIDDPAYHELFPETTLNGSNVVNNSKGSALRNADIFETVDHRGFYKSVGVGGSLTGTPADIAIIDDPVKDAIEASSITYQTRTWDWYTDVLKTRLHNHSQILLTMTRWDDGDLAGRILKKEKGWEVLRLEAIRNKENHPQDPRNIGEALWGSRHSLKRLQEVRDTSERTFFALYQQDPQPLPKGKVFPDWHKIDRHEYDKIKGIPAVGLDFGYSPDPTALTEIKVVGMNVYVKQLVYSTKLLNHQLIDKMTGLVDKGRYIYADHENDRIDEIFNKGFNIRKAKKGAGSIQSRLEFAHRYKIYVCDDSEELMQEMDGYRYKVDKEGEPLGEPDERCDDHAIDSWTYALYSHFFKPIRSTKFSGARGVKIY